MSARARGNDLSLRDGLRRLRTDEMQSSVTAIDRPARRFIPAQQALLIEARVRTGTVELVAAVEHAAQAVAAFLGEPGYHLLERGDNIHILGNQCHRRLPDVVIKTSHHKPPPRAIAKLIPLSGTRVAEPSGQIRYWEE